MGRWRSQTIPPKLQGSHINATVKSDNGRKRDVLGQHLTSLTNLNPCSPDLIIHITVWDLYFCKCRYRERCTGSLQLYVIKSKHWSFDCRSQNLYETELHWAINSTANLLIILRLKHVALHTRSCMLWPPAESIHYKSSHASVTAIIISHLLNATQNETCFRWFHFSPPDLNQTRDVLQKLHLCNSWLHQLITVRSFHGF